jgi:hypothetical protein
MWGFAGLSALVLELVALVLVGIGCVGFLRRFGVPFWWYLAIVASRLVVVGSGCMTCVVQGLTLF